jgi:pimeloyl-ACP methyl ester carboxylesterase
MSDARTVHTPATGLDLAGFHWTGAVERNFLLLHAGVCDSRSWELVAPALTGLGSVWAYDRPGFGDTPPSSAPRDHVEDAISFLDANLDGPVWLIGSSMGGAVALDLAVRHPDRVAGLVLFAPAITGVPPLPGAVETPDEQRLGELIQRASRAGDLGEANRFEIWYWLDGPGQPEGRVSGTERVLALEMNRAILEHGEQPGFDDSVEAWSHLAELTVPLTVAIGDYDEVAARVQGRELAARVPGARLVELSETAHLPYLDAPEQVISTIRAAVS